MIILFFLMGCLGLLLATLMIPYCFAFSALLVRALRTNKQPFEKPCEVSGLAILIPVHNDEEGLRLTLSSVQASIAELRKFHPNITVRVSVAVDNSNDRSSLVASGFGVNCFDTRRPKGKWNTLKALTEHISNEDWVVLCDCGTVWKKNFLTELVPAFENPNLVGIAPSFRRVNAGALSQLYWKFESHLKSLENLLGGPVSIHGATVAYRRSEFLGAMNELWEGSWQNDDVVIPLTIRAKSPRAIQYMPEVCIYDSETERSHDKDYNRRRRMAQGNSEWLAKLFPLCVERSPLVAVVALRRAFRLFWAYWLGLLLSSFILAGFSDALLFLVIFCASAVALALSKSLRSRVRNFIGASAASLESPFWLFLRKREEVRWA